jgi:hypothetical protein
MKNVAPRPEHAGVRVPDEEPAPLELCASCLKPQALEILAFSGEFGYISAGEWTVPASPKTLFAQGMPLL